MNFIRNFLQGKEGGSKQSSPSNSSCEGGNVAKNSIGDHIGSKEEKTSSELTDLVDEKSVVSEKPPDSLEKELLNYNCPIPEVEVVNLVTESTLLKEASSTSQICTNLNGNEIEQNNDHENKTVNGLNSSTNEPKPIEYFDSEEAAALNSLLNVENNIAQSGGEEEPDKFLDSLEESVQNNYVGIEASLNPNQLHEVEDPVDSSSDLHLVEDVKRRRGSKGSYKEDKCESSQLCSVQTKVIDKQGLTSPNTDFLVNAPVSDTVETYSVKAQFSLQEGIPNLSLPINEDFTSIEVSAIGNNTLNLSTECCEENFNYLEFGFENNNKPLKPLPKRLGRKNQDKKKGSKQPSKNDQEHNKRNLIKEKSNAGTQTRKSSKKENLTNSEKETNSHLSDNKTPTPIEETLNPVTKSKLHSLVSDTQESECCNDNNSPSLVPDRELAATKSNEINNIVFPSCEHQDINNSGNQSDKDKTDNNIVEPDNYSLPRCNANPPCLPVEDLFSTTSFERQKTIGNDNLEYTNTSCNKLEVDLIIPTYKGSAEETGITSFQSNESVVSENKSNIFHSGDINQWNKELENLTESVNNCVLTEELISSVILRTKKTSESNKETSDYLSNQKTKHRNSSISLSCYGNEEFEKLGDEANRLAEELSVSLITTSYCKDSMEERDGKSTRPAKGDGSSNIRTQDSSSSHQDETNQSSEVKYRNSKKADTLILQVNHSEAGPDVATGLTSSDLKCASEFFREAAELENQIRRNIASSLGSLNDYGCEGDRSSYGSESGDGYTSNKGMQPTSPPHEERSAPEGTSSPDPRSLEDSEVRNRPRSSDCLTSDEVNEILKKQALKFEEKLLRQGIVAAEKEKQLHEVLKEEQNELQKVTTSRDALLKLVEQYKGMLAALVADKDKGSNQEEKVHALEAEKRQALEDLTNVEAAFSDVHSKYERTKQIVDSLRRNEETLRNAVADYEEKLLKQEKKFIELQKHAEEKVKLVNQEFETLRRSNDQEMTKMGALLKKAEMKIISLQESLDRKTRENQELSQLCDDLISKVGS